MNPIMMNIIDFVKEFDFIKGRRLRSQGGRIYAQGGGGCTLAPPPEYAIGSKEIILKIFKPQNVVFSSQIVYTQ